MATRYSGNLKINVTYDDHNFYRASVSQDGKLLWHGRVNPAPSGFGPGVAYDSPQAYDEIARSALAFADDEVRGIGDDADFDEDLTDYLIRRKPRPKAPRALPPTASHATRKFDKGAGLKRDVGDAWIRRARQEEQSGHPRPAGRRDLTSRLVVRKVRGRWQPMTATGAVFRGNVYNADGTGYSTRQGAEEAAAMARKLGFSA